MKPSSVTVRPGIAQRSRERPFTVGEVLNQVRSCLEDNFRPLLVRGEVVDLRRPRGGNLYFTLRDRTSRLRIVVFSSTLAKIPHPLEDGAEALVWGRVTAYPGSGNVQLVAEFFEPAGLGARHVRRERLRKELQREGTFAEERKQKLPWVPRSVGIVTSATGSAIHDVRTTLARRFPGLRVVLAPATVNGADSASSITAALQDLDRRGDVDVILLVRGGGSQEDLAGFDSEGLVRAIAAARTPIVCGVGHEDDVTLSDLVADRRAPTPTGAAELAVPMRDELLSELEHRGRRLTAAMNQRIQEARRRLQLAERAHGLHAPAQQLARWRELLTAAGNRLERTHPRAAVAERHARLDVAAQRLQRSQPRAALLGHQQGLTALEARLRQAMSGALRRRSERLAAGAGRLDALSPLRVLARGYSLTTREDGGVVQRAADVSEGDVVITRLADGAIRARVLEASSSQTREPKHD